MTKLVAKGPPATVADWLAQPEDARLELIDGELIEKAMPTFKHGRAQGHTVGALGGPFDRRAGGSGGPGGWGLATEVDIVLDGRGYRPDIAGWRRDRMPAPPRSGRSRSDPTGCARSSVSPTGSWTR
jgi:Uma2 family endonuclease